MLRAPELHHADLRPLHLLLREHRLPERLRHHLCLLQGPHLLPLHRLCLQERQRLPLRHLWRRQQVLRFLRERRYPSYPRSG